MPKPIPCRQLQAVVTASAGSVDAIVIADISTRLPINEQGVTKHLEDSIITIPLDRWDTDQIPESNLGGRFGGFVGDWAAFDAAAFGLVPSEAFLMDPQQRVLLEVWTLCFPTYIALCISNI
jgi:hypothetical protein